MDKMQYSFKVDVEVPAGFKVTEGTIEEASLSLGLKPDDYTISATLIGVKDIPDPSQKDIQVSVEEGAIVLLALNSFTRSKRDFTPMSHVNTQPYPWVFVLHRHESDELMTRVEMLAKSENGGTRSAAEKLATKMYHVRTGSL